MKTRRTIHPKVLAVALAALSCGAAFAQMTATNLPSKYVYPLTAANTNAPGFIWNVNQSASFQNTTIATAEAVLAGEYGPNTADPGEIYDETSQNGITNDNPNLPVEFFVPGVINFSIAGGVGALDCGHNRTQMDLPCEDGMVGIPGTGSSTVSFAAEALTYLALPAGPLMLGVRSDDGFQLQIGGVAPGDRYSTNAVVVDEYNSTRGAADSIVTINVPKAGLYAARLLYYQGGGDANVELYTFPPAGGTNMIIGSENTGTNAVLVNDIADGGIPAYQSLTVPLLAAYVSSLTPAPGATGLPLRPDISATLVNGAVPVTAVELTLDGAVLPATVTTTTNGATISYTVTGVLANIATHTLVLSWNDNGTSNSLTSTFSTTTYTVLSASQVVTPDTTKPGFRFNIFANTSDPLVSYSGTTYGGESDNFDNTELGLNGLEPDGNGGILPNGVNIASPGAAEAAAPALGGSNAPAEFVITNTINLTAANMPGFPASDSGGNDPSHSEVLTYVGLPAGLTTFTLNLDGVYHAFMGSWDYTQNQQVGRVNALVNGNTSFSVLAPAAGYYPLRITVFNLDGAAQEALYTASAGGSNVLVGDVANGGLPAYYATSTPSKPYIRYTSPRPVPRQVEFPNNRVLVRIQDGDVKLTDSSAVFNLDGKNVTTTNGRVGDVYEMTWTATTLQTPAEIHTGVLTYQDASGGSVSSQWQFLNLKAVWLPTASVGNWVPTNAVAYENFSEYSDPTALTNDPPTTVYYPPFSVTGTYFLGAPAGQWYTSPQPENPLVDVAPIWTNVPAGPTDWFVWNWDESQGSAADTSFSLASSANGAWANFLCVDLNAFSMLESSSVNTAPGEMINGVPLTQLIADPGQNILVAESDNRAGDTVPPAGQSEAGQTQFAISKRFDLTGVTNPVLAWANIQKQNQDNLNAIEYSVDGGMTWAPVMYILDGGEWTSDPADVQVNVDNTVNVMQTLFSDGSNPGEVPTWTDSTGHVNNTYASAVAAPISQALAPFFAPRINDDNYDGKRIEVVRLPLAANKSDVRLRLAQIATCSWYFGVAQFAIYDVPPSGAIVPTGLPATTVNAGTLSIAAASGSVTVTWTGTGKLQSATALTGKASDWTTVSPAPTGNSYAAPAGSTATFFRLIGN